jgi:phospholipase C
MHKKSLAMIVSLILLFFSACTPAVQISSNSQAVSTTTGIPTVTTGTRVPDFSHIVVILFENHEYDEIIGDDESPNYNYLAGQNALLTQYYSIGHPSLPNYLALFGGDTFGVTKDCTNCFINTRSLPDQIESSGRTWKAYLEDMPSACFVGDQGKYVQKHNPFIYFDPIRLDATRCQRSVVPLTALSTDLASNSLPNFAYIMPNLCNSAHDASLTSSTCSVKESDQWLGNVVQKLQTNLNTSGESYLIVITWDEGTSDSSCCSLPKSAGGRVATLLISPQAKSGFQDGTPYTHYSLLKTIETAWNLPFLGHAADKTNTFIVAPWK